MKISTSETEILHLLRNPLQCSLQVSGVSLKQVERFKYFAGACTIDERQDEELDGRQIKCCDTSFALISSLKTKDIKNRVVNAPTRLSTNPKIYTRTWSQPQTHLNFLTGPKNPES